MKEEKCQGSDVGHFNLNIFNLLHDFMENFELEEEFFIDNFDFFVKDDPRQVGKNLICLVKNFVSLVDPDFTSLKLLYEVQKVNYGFSDLELPEA